MLSIRGIDYVSRDIANDDEAAARFGALGVTSVPVVATAGRWVPGIDLALVADLLGLEYNPQPALPAEVLIGRLRHALSTASRLIAQFPAQNLGDTPANRDRTWLALANHIVEIAAGYLEVDAGRGFDIEVSAAVPAVEYDRSALARRSRTVEAALARQTPEPERPVATFFGPATLHAVLERCAWHAAQHTRQLAATLEELGIEPDRPLTAADLNGLPLPASVQDG